MHHQTERGAVRAGTPASARRPQHSPALDDLIGGGLLAGLLYAIALVIVDGSRLLAS